MQHLVLLVILLLILGLAFTVTKWRGGLHMTFSQHAAKTRASRIFYALLFLTVLPILLWFFIVWFVPEKNLPAVFRWLVWIAVIFQVLCTFVPETGGSRTVVHRALTGISGIAMLPLIVIIASSPHLSTFACLVSWAAVVVMIAILAIALKNQKDYRYALLLQIGYYTAFFLAILVATYS